MELVCHFVGAMDQDVGVPQLSCFSFCRVWDAGDVVDGSDHPRPRRLLSER